MSDLTPKESAALRARIVEGADGLTPRRSTPSRMIAIASAVVVVAAVSAGAVAAALGIGSTNDILATPTPTPSASRTATATPTPTPTPTPTQTPTQTPTPEPTSEPTQEPPATLDVGEDLITEAQWDLLSTRGWGYYGMPGQRYVAVDPAIDLPAAVTADIQRRMDEIPNDPVGVADGTVALMATERLMGEVYSGTGKHVVMVRYNVMSAPDDPTGSAMSWYARASQQGWWMQVSKDRDKLLGEIDAWIAANTAPGSWAVFVGPGEPYAP